MNWRSTRSNTVGASDMAACSFVQVMGHGPHDGNGLRKDGIRPAQGAT
jgi:hypothetical protein